MSVDVRAFRRSGADDGQPPLQAFPIPGLVWPHFYEEKGAYPSWASFPGISQQKPLGDMEYPLVLGLTFVRNDVGPC
jgi:hypothetical protein